MLGTNPLSRLIRPTPGVSEQPTWKWGTVQPSGLVLIDHDERPLASTPDSLVTLSPGDRVYIQIFERRAVILGKKAN